MFFLILTFLCRFLHQTLSSTTLTTILLTLHCCYLRLTMCKLTYNKIFLNFKGIIMEFGGGLIFLSSISFLENVKEEDT